MSNNQQTKKERKEAQKKEKEERKQKALKAQKQKKMLTWIGGVLLGLVFIVGLSYAASQSKDNNEVAGDAPGSKVVDQGGKHVQPGAEHDEYESMPATSGPHTTAAQWGAYDEAVAYENQVHNLEHGGVIMHYNPEKVEDISEIEALFEDLYDDYPKMMLVPDTNIETRYAMTSWAWLDTFDEFDSDRMRLFTKERYNQAPEPNAG